VLLARVTARSHGQEIVEHIWIDDKPDFYDFADDAPRKTAAECLAEGG
jgi:hypothetical protein